MARPALCRALAAAVCMSASLGHALAAGARLPAWLPQQGLFGVNPDQIVEETFGTDTFTVDKAGEASDVEVKGHHWTADVYPLGPSDSWTWNGAATWRALKPKLAAAGFQVVHDDESGGVHTTLRRDQGGALTYIAINFTPDDPYSNSLHIVQTAAQTRSIVLQPPTAKPEAFSDRQDFPYLTPLPGAKLLGTSRDDVPMDVATPADKEPRFVGTSTLTKLYEGPPALSPLDFVTTYANALTAAGWTVTDRNPDAGGGYLVAHFTRNGRDVWARLWLEGADRWDAKVADVGAGLRAAAKSCRIELYGVNFDFDKSTLRPDADTVLHQVESLMADDRRLAFEIGGHTDNVGQAAYNLTLSQQRADAVKAWLVAHGIAAGRLTARGYGDKAPLVPNTSDVNRARNRRVELKKADCS